MTSKVSAKAMAIIKKMQQNELTESVIYEKLAAFAKGDVNKETLLRLAREEKAHYEIWKKYTGVEMKPETGKILKYTFSSLFIPPSDFCKASSGNILSVPTLEHCIYSPAENSIKPLNSMFICKRRFVDPDKIRR